jgi:hypothetical protein
MRLKNGETLIHARQFLDEFRFGGTYFNVGREWLELGHHRARRAVFRGLADAWNLRLSLRDSSWNDWNCRCALMRSKREPGPAVTVYTPFGSFCFAPAMASVSAATMRDPLR